MSFELKFAKRAEVDLQQIWRYSAIEWGVEQADTYIAEMRERCLRLCEHPALGPERFYGRRALRRWPAGSHILYYRIEARRIRVVRILHAAMDPRRHMS
uniref:type II toxin-antitoxin system RelE/ParE family toxin n=1 Tax=Sphingomonas sp. BE123 TaxID=2817842 RepID=UPI00386DDBE0